jgi:hypothetical protein
MPRGAVGKIRKGLDMKNPENYKTNEGTKKAPKKK